MSDQPPNPYINPSAQYAPTPPVQKKRGSGVWVWLLGGCGLLAVLVILAGAYALKSVGDQIGKSDLVKNAASLPTAHRNLAEIRAALTEYTASHGGQYPASLNQVVDESLLSYTTADGKTVKVEYAPPVKGAPEDTAVAGFYVGQMSMNIGKQGMQQRTYIRLLKDGSLVNEQITRTPDTRY